MSNSPNTICREGIVTAVSGNEVEIRITVQSACAGCHAKGVCASFETAEKTVRARTDEPLAPGDRVTVMVEDRMAWRAVLFAFVLPMLVFGVVVFALLHRDVAEPVAGIAALAAVGAYFILLHFAGKRLFRTLVFHAKKIPTSE